MGRRLMTGVVALAMVLWSLPLGATPAAASSQDIVISQVYGGGGNAGATLKNDFIELFNRGSVTIDVTGWSVQYASATGTSWAVTNIAGVIASGKYYLIQEAAGAGGTVSPPAPNAFGNIAMSATTGKVALRNNTVALSGACPAGLVDVIGYGPTATCSEGSPTAVLSNTTAAIRKGGGTQDNDANSLDFDIGAPNPRATADHAPFVASTSPANNAGGVSPAANVVVTFSEPVNVIGSWFSLTCGLTGAHTVTITGGPTAYTLDPDADFNATGETCTARILAANITDQDTEDPPDAMAADFQWSFAVVIAGVSFRIHDVQGITHLSPFVNTVVTNVPGIVTQLRPGGFYMQDATADLDDRTSEGIAVTWSTSAVSVGDTVTVTGTVNEVRTAAGNLSTTTIGGSTLTKGTAATSLPAAVRIGIDRIVPKTVIENDSPVDVESGGTFDPAEDGIDFWESLEGMRVDLGTAAVVGPSNRFGEISVVANGDTNSPSARGGVIISAADKNPERVIIKGVGFGMPGDLNVGDRLTGPSGTGVIGVPDYDFGNFMIQVPVLPTILRGGLAREVATPAGAHELTVATFNVENLDPFDGAAKFATLAGLIVHNLLSPDVISLEEVQDNDGPAGNATTAADVTLGMLRDAIVAAGGPRYEWREIDPVANQDGGEPTGNIRQVFFFDPLSGVSFVDRPGATSTTANSVQIVAGRPQLQFSPGRIDPNNAAFNSSRKPLAAEFTFNGHRLYVVANHFNSKGGDDALWGHRQPPVLGSEVQRRQQATIVRDFVQVILAIETNAEVVVLGDLNDFEFANPLLILKGAPLHDLIETLPASERYTYVFEGNSQSLDHIMVSDRLLTLGARTDIVHVNSEFWDQASDHEPQVSTLPLLDLTAPKITAPASITRSTGAGATACTVLVGDADLGVATATDDVDVPTITRSLVPAGNLFPVGSTTITYTATDGSGNTATATQTVTVIDNTPPTITAPANASYQLASQVPAANPAQATASDNCGAVTVTVAQTSNGGAGSPASPLVLTRTFTATDTAGNTAQAVQTITVADTTAPTIHAPANVTRGTGVGATSCGLFVADGVLGNALADDNSGSVNIVRTGVPAGSFFPVGTTTLVYTATDPSNNTATATQTVTILDDTPPTITAPANASYQQASLVPAASAADASVADNCGAPTVAVSELSNGGAGSPASPLIITRTYSATDAAGNHASATQVITVIDNISPTITGATTTANANGWWNTPVTIHFTCSDNVGIAFCTPDVTLTGDGANQLVTGTATDVAGNSASATVSNISIDRTIPTITFTGSTSYTPDQNVAITCAATDALSGIDPARPYLCQSASGPAYLFLGTNTLNASVWDRAGNNATATQTFTVGVTSDSICVLIERYVSKDGVAKSLCGKIEKAAERLAQGRDKNFENELRAFTNEVNAQRGKSITDANATLLITLAGMI